MANRISLEELKSYLWQSAVLLRTNIDAGAYKQYIFPLMFFKRICDVYDEETAKAVEEYGEDVDLYPEHELHQFLVPKGHHWNDVRQITEDVGTAIVAAFRAIEKANGNKMTGIFGDGAWTNKNRLSDRLLRDLLEHFSSQNLSLENCPEDELGQGYEYLIKQFADDSGHTAQEFYTNRTVVHLMTEILQPESGESVYDPTCGSAGMLISCIAHLKNQGKEWRNLQVYGQEINKLTSAIGRMNLFLHGIEDFHIANDDTLKNPAFIEKGQLKRFDLVLANPPYSISQWDRAAFESDKYGRNVFGTPPQSRADYAFIQHIISSLKLGTGRAAILLPHGVLNRNEEKEIRKAIISSDCVDAVIGLGRHLFYNSGLESCILILRSEKPKKHKRSILFIEAEKCTHKVQSQNYLFDEDIDRITQAYFSDIDIPDFSRRVSIDDILANDGNLNIKRYVSSDVEVDDGDFLDNLDSYLSASVSAYAQYQLIDEDLAESPLLGKTVDFEDYDKSNWKKVKLCDVAEEYSERIEDPANSDFEWYIGSDCIDGFAFTISRKQDARKIHSAQKLFRTGDYLLVRRSLYGSDFRERAPRADFDGICSADILTIREKPGAIIDGYLITVLYSKELWKFIVSNSTGSLTRRIKWNQLKEYEFYLPPEGQQRQIVDTLWAMERVKTAYKELISKTDDLVKAQFVELFGDPVENEKGWKKRQLQDFVSDDCSISYGIVKTENEVENGVPVFRPIDIVNGRRPSLSELKKTSKEISDTYRRSILTGRDMLITVRANIGDTFIADEEFKGCNVGRGIVPIRTKENIISLDYLRAQIEYSSMKEYLKSLAKGIALLQLNMADLRKVEFIIPPADKQAMFINFINSCNNSKSAAQRALKELANTQRALMRTIFT